MMSTVLPTPAPPNRPILPPLAYGASRSTTLMPVTRICASVAWSAKEGAGAWIGRAGARLDGARLVHRLADDVDDAPERLVADRHRDRAAGVASPPGRAPGLRSSPWRWCAPCSRPVLRDLEHEAVAVVLGLERVEDLPAVARRTARRRRRPSPGECDQPFCHLAFLVPIRVRQSASAPEMISMSSLVIMAWRVRLYFSVSLSIISPALRVALSMALICAP